MSTYQELCSKYGININTRWEDGEEHHPEANGLLRECFDLDYNEYSDYFGWKVGGDGDNGEVIIEQVSVLFEIRDAELAEKYPNAYSRIKESQKDNESCLEVAIRLLEEGTGKT